MSNNFSFINNGKELVASKEVLSTISIFELFIFGGLAKNPKGKSITFKVMNPSTMENEITEYAVGDMCDPNWIRSGGKVKSPLASTYRTINAVNAVLMYRKVRGSVLPEGWLDALEQGGYWDKAGTVPTLRWWLTFWGHAPKVYTPECNWFSQESPEMVNEKFNDFKGKRFNESTVLEYWWLPASAPFGEYFTAVATAVNKENDSVILYDTLEVKWGTDRVWFPSFRKEGRYRYTWKSWEGDSYNWVRGNGEGDIEALGNVLFWWSIHETPLAEVSAMLNRDATNLVAPSRMYGHPSPLNKASDRCTVGHLKLRLANPGKGCMPSLPEVLNDDSAYAAAEAAKFAFEEGLPVLFQHQLENIRVGLAAAGLGKSTVQMIMDVTTPEGATVKAKVRLSLGQFLVDKATKLFNRDSLEFRVTPGLEVDIEYLTEEDKNESETLLEEFSSFAASLLLM